MKVLKCYVQNKALFETLNKCPQGIQILPKRTETQLKFIVRGYNFHITAIQAISNSYESPDLKRYIYSGTEPEDESIMGSIFTHMWSHAWS